MSSNHSRKSKTIVICSASGGVGKTSLAVNFSACIAAQNNRVTVMDADFSFGDLAPAFDIKPELTIKEAAEHKDSDNIHAYLQRSASGGDVLLAPQRPEYAELISPEFLDDIIPRLQEDIDWLLIDTGTGLSEINLQLMEKADFLFVIAAPGMAIMKNTKLMFETLELLGLKDKAHVIINKFTSSTVLRTKKLPSLLNVDRDRIHYVPRDDKHIDYSLDIGKPLVLEKPKLTFSKEMKELAAVFHAGDTAGELQKDINRGLLSRLKDRRN